MKLYNITNIKGLFDVIDECDGRVDLVDEEGNRINLKSKIAQYVSIAKVIKDGEISELELVAYEPEDTHKLFTFMMNNEDPEDIEKEDEDE